MAKKKNYEMTLKKNTHSDVVYLWGSSKVNLLLTAVPYFFIRKVKMSH